MNNAQKAYFCLASCLLGLLTSCSPLKGDEDHLYLAQMQKVDPKSFFCLDDSPAC
jgi:hypothetical protein